MDNMSKEEANKKIANNLEQIKALLQENYELADRFALEFSSPIDEYGMGGEYVGRGQGEYQRDESEWYYSNAGWQASSTSC